MRLKTFVALLCYVFVSTASVFAADQLVISEFVAENDSGLKDQDGDYSDWIEIHNAGTNIVNLNGWYLTDTINNLTKWRFPATNIAPNGYLLVFASEKDRRTPGRELHTNFRLEKAGEYLALVKPDGITVAHAYSPQYPPQVDRVSYGIPLQQSVFTLLSTGAAAKVLIPANNTLGQTWIAPNFNDSTWTSAQTGIGFETDGQGPFTPVAIADSYLEFSGNQGSNNWYYGYWDKKGDANGVYSDFDFLPFPSAITAYGPSNYWNGTAWDWFNGDPPFTQLTATGGLANANNGNAARADHWTIRRYLSEVTGSVKITGRLANTNSTDWVYVTQTGVAANSILYLYLTGVGDGYIDDIKLVAGSVPEVGANLLPNGDFESALTGPWTVSANHSASAIVTDVKHGGSASLHMVTSVGGTTQGSSIWQTIAPALANGDTYTLSYWFKPGSVASPLVTRFSGNWINASPILCGDGVIGRIFVDGISVYTQTVAGASIDYSLTVPVNFGSRIDFALDPRGDDLCDNAVFTAHIETADPGNLIVADSVVDWSSSGTQGANNWYYGYYNRTADAGGVYAPGDFTPFPRDNGPNGPQNFWTGVMWDWFNGNPPWDEIGQTGMHPNGVNNPAGGLGGEHWVIRRWVSEVSGRVTIDWTVRKTNPAGAGVTGRVLHNGVQQDAATIAGTDAVGVNRSITVTNVHVGDFIDIALDPTGVGGDTGDASDGSAMTATIRGTPTLTDSIASDIGAAMRNVNASAYIRIPFVVTNSSSINFLTLRMKYDDGFVANLNGVHVVSRNDPIAPEVLTWNSAASASRFDGDANQWVEIDITPFIGLLHDGTNVLAIQGLNAFAGDSDFLILPEIRAVRVASDLAAAYFSGPTPGLANGLGSTNIGPIISDVKHTPNVPQDNEDLYVTAKVSPTFNSVSNVQMIYRVMYGNEIALPMLDDGLHGDGLAGDGVYGAIIPATASTIGQMVRYYIFARDTGTNTTRVPSYLSATTSPQYLGTVVYVAQTNGLPLLHLFITDAALNSANNDSAARYPCSVFYRGRFYDNCGINRHGQSSTGFPKKSYDLEFNRGYHFDYKDGEELVSDVNLLTTYPDKAHIRNFLGYYGTYQASGSPYHWVEHIRIHTNGGFFGDWHMMENGNSDFLARVGLDPNGALYKMYATFTDPTHTTISVNANAEKKSRKTDPTGNADLVALFNGVSPTVNTTPAGRAAYMYDNINVPEVVNTMAARIVTGDVDCCHKNYYFYRDSDGTGEWSAIPWDIDLAFGRNWNGTTTYWDDPMYPNNGLYIGNNNYFFQLVMGNGTAAATGFPQSQQMYLRRLRTLLDEIMQPTNTPPSELKYEKMIAELSAKFMADATLDLQKWGSWGHGAPSIPTNDASYLTVPQAITQLLNYLPTRRNALIHAKTAGSSTQIPNSQPTNIVINIGTIEYNPSSANQAQEYIQLINPNNISVDVSGWKLSGAIDFTLPAGAVIVTNGILYVSPDVKAFRARGISPKGGERNLVVGPYKGQLSARGETLTLTDTRGRVVTTNLYIGNPSGPQQYLRITEIMYHPPAPGAGSPYLREDFEYIELKNTGPVSINLGGVHFTNGVEFAFGPASNLGPGVSIILAKNPAAFASRYPGVTNVVGPYDGSLDNAGENIRLDDAVGEKILDFSYNNSWYPMTDGNGFSLVIVNENALWYTWDLKESWRPSGVVIGTPGVTGTNEPPTLTFASIVVNEVLTHTDFPTVDAIELHNPTTNAVDVGNWWISDDFFTPSKYRIPAPRVIPPGGYTYFTEGDFNIGPNSFSFSSQGDEAYVFSGNPAGQLTGYFQGYSFGAAGNGVSFGRYTNSQGEVHFVAQSNLTFNAQNARPKVGPIVISEIMYHPSDIVSATNVLDNDLDEFVELYNTTATPVPLYDPAFPTNRWKLANAVDLDFSTNAVVPANGYLLAVSFDPVTNGPALAAFRLKYGVPVNVPIAGPYSGKLDNSEETVELYRPDSPDTNGVPFVLVDAIHYKDLAPWDFAADGFGLSLQRRVKTDYGNDPTNWFAALPNAGAASSSGQPPTITQQPRPLTTIVEGRTTNLTLTVTGTPPLAYQWRRNGLNILNETNATLTFPNIQAGQTGIYSVVVYNVAGAAFSSNAVVNVLPLPLITQQPLSQNVQPTSNVTLSVSVNFTPPVSYQWRFNGTNIPNATNAIYSFANAELFAHTGYYDVLVQDAVASVLSQTATIIVLARPVITNQPVAVNVVQGGTAVFSLVAGPTHPLLPLAFRWIRAGAPYITSSVPVLVLTNVQTSASIRCAVTNLSTGLGGLNSSTVQMTVVPDFDGDGIADLWEVQYGLNTNEVADGSADLDGDGMSNHDEYIAGTNPMDPSSLLKLVTLGTNKTLLEFVAQTNMSYTVQTRTNLTSAPWATWTNIFPAPSARTIQVNSPYPPPESLRFYRIITPIVFP